MCAMNKLIRNAHDDHDDDRKIIWMELLQGTSPLKAL